jgi:hypothetical protein
MPATSGAKGRRSPTVKFKVKSSDAAQVLSTSA